jgi:hypothetical protein
MFQQAILAQAKEGEDFTEITLRDEVYRLRTPEYFGALALNDIDGRSLILMSNVLTKGFNEMTESFFSKVNPTLLGIAMRILEETYPEASIKWDHSNGHWITDCVKKELVRIDIFGANGGLNLDDFRPEGWAREHF